MALAYNIGRDTGSLRVQGRGLSKQFVSASGPVHALREVSIDIHPGEMVVLLGPSGCGKTTLLRSIAGLEQPQAGEIEIDGRLVYSAARRTWVPPERRRVAMVFQSYALWPHMTVMDNISYPLQSQKLDRATIRQKVGQVMEAVGLSGMAERLPSQLSGGQQQRVALARAIAAESHVVLFDEPLSNVDAKVRDQIRREIVSLQRQLGFAGLYVTHDQVEAGALADTLVVMDHGRVAQVGSPSEVYDSPNTRYVATFMGPSNEVTGKIAKRGPDRTVQVDTSWGPILGNLRSGDGAVGSEVDILFRPETCQLYESEPGGPNVWPCRVERRTFMGAFMELWLTAETQGRRFQLTALAPKTTFPEGAEIWAQLPTASAWVFAR